jgi:hypothetical protein
MVWFGLGGTGRRRAFPPWGLHLREHLTWNSPVRSKKQISLSQLCFSIPFVYGTDLPNMETQVVLLPASFRLQDLLL